MITPPQALTSILEEEEQMFIRWMFVIQVLPLVGLMN